MSSLHEQIQKAILEGRKEDALALLARLGKQPSRFASGLADDVFAGCETVFVRLKPYDPSAGQKVRRAAVPEITRVRTRAQPRLDPATGRIVQEQVSEPMPRVLRGGTGMPGDIPEWVEVPVEVGRAVLKYRQDPRNPRSPALFDVVTPEERAMIDEAEQRARERAIAMNDPEQVRRQTVAQVTAAGVRGKEVAPVREAPSVAQAAERFLEAPAVEDARPLSPADRSRLAAALGGDAGAGGEGKAPVDLSAETPDIPDLEEDMAEVERAGRAPKARVTP